MFNIVNRKLKIIILIILVLIIVSAAFSPSLKNGFVNFDDSSYVVKNENIQSFSWNNIYKVFSFFYFGNYHPLTLLSYSLDYHFFKLKPLGYHITNLTLYLLSCILVFWLLYIFQGSLLVAFITTLLFGLHPLHVEPVAWVSSRKDLLYALFFLAAMISYTYYLKTNKVSRYYLTFLLFILSILSKAMAVTFPIILLLIDYLLDKRRNRIALIDKVPFFAVSFIFSILAVFGQSSAGAIRGAIGLNFFDKIKIAGYSVFFYLNKIFMPVKLACLYPRIGNQVTVGFLVLPLTFIFLVIAIFLFGSRSKKIIFGGAFFLITLIPNLQFIPVSETIVADRYVYLPLLGILFLIGEGFAWLYAARTKYSHFIRLSISIILICILSTLCLLSWRRCKIWGDNLTLWNDVLGNYPNAIMAYNNRGITFWAKGEYSKAISDFNYVINFVSDSDRELVYLYLASLYRAVGKNKEAMASYEKAREIKSKFIRK